MQEQQETKTPVVDPFFAYYAKGVFQLLDKVLSYQITDDRVYARISLLDGTSHIGTVYRVHFDTLEEAKLKALEFALASLFRSTRIVPKYVDMGANPYSMSVL